MMSHSRRLSLAFEACGGLGVEALLISAPANVRYLSGFTGSNGWLLLTAGPNYFLTDPRYQDQAAEQLPDLELVVSNDGLDKALARVLGGNEGRALGFESAHITVAAAARMKESVKSSLVPVEGVVEALRKCKDDAEIDAIRRSLRLTEQALVEVARTIRPGQTERQIAADLEKSCRCRGADGMAFDTIVASGPRSALPHGVATDRAVQQGEPVTIDMGCRLDGYCSDITRMVWCGATPSEDWLQLHRLVDRARAAALELAGPGVGGVDVDGAARTVIDTAGHGRDFSHGTGHGVGLEIHEGPAVSQRSREILQPGMVITIEPGVYLRGRGGVRIEDMVRVADEGCERLTALGTEPILAQAP